MKFYDAIGYGVSVERPEGSGKWVKDITERKLFGEIINPARSFEEGDKVNSNASISNRFSILADDYMRVNQGSILYIKYRGVRYHVTNIKIEYPRLILTPGGVYSGKTPTVTDPV